MAKPDRARVLAALSAEEMAELDALLSAKELWEPRPQNKPQQMAYASTATVIGYGGAAGGGKTDLAIGMSLMKHRVVQFFRREGTELTPIVDRCAAIVGNREGLTGRPPLWRNPTKTCDYLQFGSIPHLGDELGFQGLAKDFMVFDEATNFLEQQVRFLMTWLRSVEGVPCQMLLTFNPPTTPEGMWVISYFAPWLDHRHPNPAKPGELRWFVTPDEKEIEVDGPEPVVNSKGRTVLPQSRTFIFAKVDDNPDLASSQEYRAMLDSLEPELRARYRDGDFRVAMQDHAMQVIPTAWVEAAQARWKPLNPMPPMDSIGVDVAMGGKDNTVIARRHGGWFDVPIVYEGKRCPNGPTVAGYVKMAQRDRAPIHIDMFGVGAEPYGFLMRDQAPVLGVSMSEPTGEMAIEGRRRFFNIRSMLWWRMREALNPTNTLQISLPPSRLLLADLCTVKWEERAGGVIKVQGREEIVETIGRSPDYGTAYILALMHTPALRGIGQREEEYDAAKDMDSWRTWRNQR